MPKTVCLLFINYFFYFKTIKYLYTIFLYINNENTGIIIRLTFFKIINTVIGNFIKLKICIELPKQVKKEGRIIL